MATSKKRVPDGMSDAIKNFINQPTKEEPAAGGAFHVDGKGKNTRSRRVGFVMTENDYQEMKDYCDAQGVSVSEFINQATKWAMNNG